MDLAVGSDSITLPDPELRNIERWDLNFVLHRSIDNSPFTYLNGPIIKTIDININLRNCGDNRRDIIRFLKQYLLEQVEYTFNSVTLDTVLFKTDAEYVEQKNLSNLSISLRII